MHIALYTPGWPLAKFHNGVVTFVDSSRREFERRGHTVSVFVGNLDASVRDARVHGLRRGFSSKVARRLMAWRGTPGADVFAIGRALAATILEVHRREPIDVIEMEESFGWSADVARLTGIPLLVKLHGPAFLTLVDEERETPFGRERIEREGRALARATAIAAPARRTLELTLERYRLRPALCECVVNPVTVDPDMPVWTLEGCDPKTILFVGRFDRLKGADVLLQAFALLLREQPDLTLVFVGPDKGLRQDDGSVVPFDAYREALLPAPLRARIEYRGRMANHEIGALRVRAMVTVNASRWENQSYTVLEAMLQGCPVVASDVGGNAESVSDGVTGLLARSEDPTAFAAQLRAMLADPRAAARMGRAAREHALRTHAAATVAQASLALYERVIAQTA